MRWYKRIDRLSPISVSFTISLSLIIILVLGLAEANAQTPAPTVPPQTDLSVMCAQPNLSLYVKGLQLAIRAELYSYNYQRIRVKVKAKRIAEPAAEPLPALDAVRGIEYFPQGDFFRERPPGALFEISDNSFDGQINNFLFCTTMHEFTISIKYRQDGLSFKGVTKYTVPLSGVKMLDKHYRAPK